MDRENKSENKVYYNDENITIRSMKESDISKIYNSFKEQSWNREINDFENYFNEQQSSIRDVLIAEYLGDVAGYVTLVHEVKAGPYKGEPTAEIVDFNVFMKYQRHGVGSRLLDIAENIAKEKYKFVVLGVGLHNGYGAAQRMYIKRGYIPDGTGVWYNDKNLEQYAPCNNDDSLILYLKKEF